MADSLRLELAPDGIDVSIVEPGTIATPIWTKPQPLADELARADRTSSATASGWRRSAVAAERAPNTAAPRTTVRSAVEHALTAERPKTRYLVGRDAKIRAAIERLPDRLRDRVLRRALLGG